MEGSINGVFEIIPNTPLGNVYVGIEVMNITNIEDSSNDPVDTDDSGYDGLRDSYNIELPDMNPNPSVLTTKELFLMFE